MASKRATRRPPNNAQLQGPRFARVAAADVVLMAAESRA